jgi:hypothetical protein
MGVGEGFAASQLGPPPRHPTLGIRTPGRPRSQVTPGIEPSLQTAAAGFAQSRRFSAESIREKRPTTKGKIARRYTVSSRLGGLPYKKDLFERAVPALGGQTWEEAGHYRRRPQHPRHGVLHAETRLRLPRTRGGLRRANQCRRFEALPGEAASALGLSGVPGTSATGKLVSSRERGFSRE